MKPQPLPTPPADASAARANLERLVRDNGETYSSLSRMVGRKPAYLRDFVKRGTPRRLSAFERQHLARYFDVDECALGADS